MRAVASKLVRVSERAGITVPVAHASRGRPVRSRIAAVAVRKQGQGRSGEVAQTGHTHSALLAFCERVVRAAARQ